MTILEDEGQKQGFHYTKHSMWDYMGVEVVRMPLPVGDYVLLDERTKDVIDRKKKRNMKPKKMDFLGTYDVCVDTKYDILELVNDICGKQHERFRDECILAQNNGIKLFVLVENRGELIPETKDIFNPTIKRLEDLHRWKNPRLFLMKRSSEVAYYKNGKPVYKRVQRYPNATRGETLQKACMTMEKKYGVKFLFCRPDEAAEMVISLLTGKCT